MQKNSFIKLYFFLGSSSSLSLDEVGLHVTLEIEVAELVVLAKLKKSGKLSVGNDEAAIIGTLEVVGANVGIDLLAHIGTSHLGTDRLAKEVGKLVTDTSRLHKSRGLTVTGSLGLLGRRLLGSLQLTGHILLKGLEITLDGRENARNLLDLGTELSHLLLNTRSLLNNLVGDRSSNGSRLSNYRSSLLSSLGGLLGGSLLGRGSGRLLSGGGLRCSYHSKYTLYRGLFLSGLTH